MIFRRRACLTSLAVPGAVLALLLGSGSGIAAEEKSGWSFSKEPTASLIYEMDALKAVCESGKIGPEIPVTLKLDLGTQTEGAFVDINFQSEDFDATYAGTVAIEDGGARLPVGIEDPLWKILKTKEQLSFGITGLNATKVSLEGAASPTKSFLDVCRTQFAAADAAAREGEMITETFVCEDGTKLIARFDNSRSYSVAHISYDGKPEVALIQVQSGSGAKYSNGDYTLHAKGDDAVLSQGQALRRCRAN